jgi:hypothetical protein
MYVNEALKKNPIRIMNLNDIYTYIKNGKFTDLPDLRKLDELVENDFTSGNRMELVTKLPGISLGFRFTKDWFNRPRPEFLPSNLLVFDFIAGKENILDKLDGLAELKCVILSYNNYFDGKTIVVKTNNKNYKGTIWTFPMIKQIFEEWIGEAPPMDLGPNIVPLRHDPNVIFNPNAIPFGEMRENSDFIRS